MNKVSCFVYMGLRWAYEVPLGLMLGQQHGAFFLSRFNDNWGRQKEHYYHGKVVTKSLSDKK